MFGLLDGLEHGGEGLVAVEERGDFGAGEQGAVDDAVDQRQESDHGLAGLREALAEGGFCDGLDGGLGAKLSLGGAQALGAAANAIDAEHEVGEDADKWGEPYEGYPGDGRAWFAAR